MNEHELLDAVSKLPKSIEPPRDLWPAIEARISRRASTWQRRWYWVPLAAAAVLLLFLLGRRESDAWDVTALAGRPLIGQTRLAASGHLRVGDWVQTDDSSRALIAVGKIGQVEVRPDTRLQLVVATASEHRLALARGTIDATVSAVPRLFFVETPAGTAIDLGCAYTLETDSLGKGLLHVTAGEVEFQTGSQGSRVPLGALVQTRPGIRRRAGSARARAECGRFRARQGTRGPQRARTRAAAGCVVALASAAARGSGAPRRGV